MRRGCSVVFREMHGLSGLSWLVFRPYISSDPAIALVAGPLMFVLVQCRIVFLPVEGLSTDGALEDVCWTTGSAETRASGRFACR